MPGQEPLVLEGRFVRLEPLSEAHIDPLVAAASEDRSNYQWSTAPNGRAQTERYVNDAMAKVASGEQVAFATVRKGGGSAARVVGSTRFYEVATWRWPDGSPHQRAGVPDVVDIGYTWLAASAQRSPRLCAGEALIAANTGCGNATEGSAGLKQTAGLT